MSMDFDIFSTISQMVNLSFAIFEVSSSKIEYKKTAIQLHSQLRKIETHIYTCKQYSDLSCELGSDLRVCIKAIHDDLQKFDVDTEGDIKLLHSAMSVCDICLAIVFQLRMSHEKLLQRNFLDAVQDVQNINTKVVGCLESVTTEFKDNVGAVVEAVKQIPLGNTTAASDTLQQLLVHTEYRPSKKLDFEIESGKECVAKCFAKMLFAAHDLIGTAEGARLSSAYACYTVHCIKRLWEEWQIDKKHLDFENIDGMPHVLASCGDSFTFAALHVTKTGDVSRKDSQVAVKSVLIDVRDVGGSLYKLFLQLTLSSDYLVRVHGVCWPYDVGPRSSRWSSLAGRDDGATSRYEALIVMERMTCTLERAVSEGWIKTPKDKFGVLYDVCKAMTYLSDRKLVHGDLKPDNVLVHIVESKLVGVAKVAYSGFMQCVHDIRIAEKLTKRSLGEMSIPYIPPEISEHPDECHIRESWDVWSYGILVCFLLLPPGTFHWSLDKILAVNKNGEMVTSIQNCASSIDEELFRSIAHNCLSAKEDDRPRFSMILKELDGVAIESNKGAGLDVYKYDTHNSTDESPDCRTGQEGSSIHTAYCKDVDCAEENSKRDFNGRSSGGTTEIPRSISSSVLHHQAEVEENATKLSKQFVHESDNKCASMDLFLNDSCERNTGAEKYIRDAVEQYSKAMDACNVIAKCYLELHFKKDIDVTKAPHAFRQKFREVSAEGSAAIKAYLGWCHLKGFGVDKNFKKAASFYRQASIAGIPIAKVMRGLCHLNSVGGVVSARKAAEMFRQGSMAKNRNSEKRLGSCNQIGIVDEQDSKEFMRLYTEASRTENWNAKLKLGLLCESSVGVHGDARRAMELFEKSSDVGRAHATLMLGVCYETGFGENRDVAEAVKCYEYASDVGSAYAMFMLGMCYENGVGVGKDAGEAVGCYKKAAIKSCSHAMFMVGFCYEKGVGVDKDIRDAVKYYECASAIRKRVAGRMIRVCQENSVGVDEDFRNAADFCLEES